MNKKDPVRRHSATGPCKSKQPAPTCETITTPSSDHEKFSEKWVQARFRLPPHLASLYAEKAGLGGRSK